MGKEAALIIIYFIALAIADFSIYALLSKYLFISAGVTKEDARRFISEQTTHQQERLARWLKRNAKHPKEFNVMFAICNALIFLSFASSAMIFANIVSLNNMIVKLGAIIIPIISAALAVYGFSYGKNVERSFGDYFSSEEYMPYEGESEDEIENSDEPLRYELSAEEIRHRKMKKSGSSVFNIIFSLVIIGVGLSGIFANKLNPKQADINDIPSIVNTDDIPEQYTSINADIVKNLLSRSGYVPYDGLNEAAQAHPEFDIAECVIADEGGMRMEYYRLKTEKDAAELQKKVQAEIEAKHKNGESSKEQKRSGFYTLETPEGYAAAIQSENSVVYTYSEPINAAWVKSTLYTLGLLKDF